MYDKSTATLLVIEKQFYFKTVFCNYKRHRSENMMFRQFAPAEPKRLNIKKIGSTPSETIFSIQQDLSIASVVWSAGWTLQFLDLRTYLLSHGREDLRRNERIEKFILPKVRNVYSECCIAEIHTANNIYRVFAGNEAYSLNDSVNAMKQIQQAILPPPPPPDHIQFHFPSSEDDELPPLTPLSGISSSDDENF